jgi:hypothetical protein
VSSDLDASGGDRWSGNLFFGGSALLSMAGVAVSLPAIGSGWRSVFVAVGILTAAACIPAPGCAMLARMAVLGGLGSPVGARTAFFVQPGVSNRGPADRAARPLVLSSGFGVGWGRSGLFHPAMARPTLRRRAGRRARP